MDKGAWDGLHSMVSKSWMTFTSLSAEDEMKPGDIFNTEQQDLLNEFEETEKDNRMKDESSLGFMLLYLKFRLLKGLKPLLDSSLSHI